MENKTTAALAFILMVLLVAASIMIGAGRHYDGRAKKLLRQSEELIEKGAGPQEVEAHNAKVNRYNKDLEESFSGKVASFLGQRPLEKLSVNVYNQYRQDGIYVSSSLNGIRLSATAWAIIGYALYRLLYRSRGRDNSCCGCAPLSFIFGVPWLAKKFGWRK
jgi:hypothetical protein